MGGNFSPGNGNIVKFTDTNYEKIRNGQIIDQGTYTLSSGNNPQTESMMNRINYHGGYYEYYEIVNRQLILYSGVVAADGTISRYARQ